MHARGLRARLLGLLDLELKDAVRARRGLVLLVRGHDLVAHAALQRFEALVRVRALDPLEVLHEEAAPRVPAHAALAAALLVAPAARAAGVTAALDARAAGRQQVVDLLHVDLHVRAAHAHALQLLRRRRARRGAGAAGLAPLHALEELADRARHQPDALVVHVEVDPRRAVRAGRRVLVALHRVGLAARRLAVGKDRGVEAVHDLLHHALGARLLEHLLLRRLLVEHAVVREALLGLAIRGRVAGRADRDLRLRRLDAQQVAAVALLLLLRDERAAAHAHAHVLQRVSHVRHRRLLLLRGRHPPPVGAVGYTKSVKTERSCAFWCPFANARLAPFCLICLDSRMGDAPPARGLCGGVVVLLPRS